MNMTFITNLEKQLSTMQGISLEEMNHVKLMRRTDTKFVVPVESLSEIIDKVKDSYMVFEIAKARLQPYETVYFDTSDYEMYHRHHNRRSNRYKVRLRQYSVSGDRYLEIKYKNNKQVTDKRRRPAGAGLQDICEEGAAFVSQHSPYAKKDLKPVIRNHFSRITFVSKYRPERLTIDVGLSYEDIDGHKSKTFNHLAIIEVKRERDARQSDVIDVLHEMRVKAMGFSKYCMGLAVMNPKVKFNLFKLRLRKYKLLELKFND